MTRNKKIWKFTSRRRASIKHARQIHETYVRLGKKAYAEGKR